MGSRYFKTRRKTRKYHTKPLKSISLDSQLERIKTSFPSLILEEKSSTKFVVIIKLSPNVLSKEYEVKIVFEIGKVVSVFIVNEKLQIAENRKKLPHVYDNKLQKICLYSKDGGKWDSTKSIVSTVIPWASEWLYYYELWLIDGIWRGGGHNEYVNENVVKNEQ